MYLSSWLLNKEHTVKVAQRRTIAVMKPASGKRLRAEPYFYFYGFFVLLACLFVRFLACCLSGHLLSFQSRFLALALKPMLLDIDDTIE